MRAYRWGGTIACLTLGLAMAGGCEPKSRSQIEMGTALPEFSLQMLNGGTLNSMAWRGQTTILNIWATWCEPCRTEMPSLQKLSRALDAPQFQVIGLSVDTDRNLVREFVLEYGVTFPLAIDPDGQLAKRILGLEVVPDTLLIGPDGRVVDRRRGSADWIAPALVTQIKALDTGYGGVAADHVVQQRRN